MLILPFARGGQMKLRRQHSDDCVDDIVERECLPEIVALPAEMAAEKRIGQDDNACLLRIGRGRVEACPERRLHSEEREDVRRSARAFDPLRLRPAGQVEVRVFKSGHRFELRGLPAPLQEIRVSRRQPLPNRSAQRRIFFPQHHNPLRIA